MIIVWGLQYSLTYSAKYFWSLLNSNNLTFQQLFCKSKVNKTVQLVSLEYTGIITVITMTHFLAKIYFSLMRVLKSKEKKLVLTFLYYLGQETWLDDSWKLIYINRSGFYNYIYVGKSKTFKNNFDNITIHHLQAESRI